LELYGLVIWEDNFTFSSILNKKRSI